MHIPVTRTVLSDDPTQEATYGRDIWCIDRLRTGRYAVGIARVAQRCYHRLITPRGMLRGGEEEQDFGIDLAGMIGSANTKQDAAALPGQIANELKKDPAVDEVTVTIVTSTDGPATSYAITIDVETNDGPFELVVAVTDVTVDLLKITVANDVVFEAEAA